MPVNRSIHTSLVFTLPVEVPEYFEFESTVFPPKDDGHFVNSEVYQSKLYDDYERKTAFFAEFRNEKRAWKEA